MRVDFVFFPFSLKNPTVINLFLVFSFEEYNNVFELLVK